MHINYSVILLIIIATYVSQALVRFIIDSLNNSIEKFIELNKDNSNDKFQKEIESFKLVKIKKHHLSYITKIVGYMESFFFIAITASILIKGGDIKSVVPIVGGWVGLKIFGNYQQWSGVVLGRATFYVFLIGSLFNIIFSILLGIFYYLHY